MLEELGEIVKHAEPLAPYTVLKIGGPVEALVQPRTRDELATAALYCFRNQVPFRVIGGGAGILVRDEGVAGVVVRLCEPAFTQVEVSGSVVRAGAGAMLSALISATARHELEGLETLIGIPGTVGGGLRGNAGDRSGEIGQFVRRVEVLDDSGTFLFRERDELRFAHRSSNLDDPVIVAAEFVLQPDRADAIVKRMRKAWITRKARQPLSFQPACRIFKNPPGLNAAALIEQAELVPMRVGGAEISDRDPNYIIAHPGTTARDVLRLIDLVKSKVNERFRIDLELEIAIW